MESKIAGLVNKLDSIKGRKLEDFEVIGTRRGSTIATRPERQFSVRKAV
jgi:hypothetical protein